MRPRREAAQAASYAEDISDDEDSRIENSMEEDEEQEVVHRSKRLKKSHQGRKSGISRSIVIDDDEEDDDGNEQLGTESMDIEHAVNETSCPSSQEGGDKDSEDDEEDEELFAPEEEEKVLESSRRSTRNRAVKKPVSVLEALVKHAEESGPVGKSKTSTKTNKEEGAGAARVSSSRVSKGKDKRIQENQEEEDENDTKRDKNAVNKKHAKGSKSKSSKSSRKRRAMTKRKIVEPERSTAGRRSGRQPASSGGNYAEASSDDEFARENFMLGSGSDQEEEDEEEDSGAEEDEDNNEEEVVDYSVEIILATKSLPASEWRAVCGKMNTREVTRGSVWVQPAEEYESEAAEPVKKYLIKWAHASYLHVSWETTRDLVEMANPAVKAMLKHFDVKRAPCQLDSFNDLRADELIPPAFFVIERILDVEDDSVNVHTMPYDTAVSYDDSQEDVLNSEGEERVARLHGKDCFVVVKWEDAAYSDVSFESVADIRARGIEYEPQLRLFYRREQRAPALNKKSRRVSLADTFDASSIQAGAPPEFPGGVLREYQWDGVKWLLFNWTQRRNSILADEMGLGKTIQAACFLEMLRTNFHQRGPFLIIAPLSTVVNWQREISSWTNLDVVLYYGSQEDRKIAREHEFFYTDREKCAGYKIEVVITTPETAMAMDQKQAYRNSRELSKVQWDAVIIDEAHKCKNYDSKFTSLLRDEYSYHSCLLLTGTPLQNNIEELWTLLNFVDRKEFADKELFTRKFGDLKSATQLDALHSKLKPYLLRREKEHVEKSVPPKQEVLIEVELTSIQKQYYRAIYEQKTSFLCKKEAKDGPSLTNLAMELRKCCLHLFLIKGAQAELYSHFKDDPPVDIITKASAKMTLLDKLLPKLKAEGHRVLIFSQFRIMLDIIEDYLELKQHSYERVDGTIMGKDRQRSIDKFTNEDHVFVMLLSTRAGGVGINLTQADTVIIFDSDWNPQNDLQAQARAHRIGQLKPVKVYRLLTKNTYEQAMFRAASIKLGLDYAVMHNMHNTNSGMEGISADKAAENFSAVSRRELENLLKHGAYGAFGDQQQAGEGGGDRLSEEETIEQILSRSEVILHDSGSGGKTEGDTKKASFAKASFVSAASTDASNTVSIDDPDFWHKVVGLAVEEKDTGITSKRKCRDFVGSYKEPGMTVKGTTYDSDDGNDSDTPGGGGGRGTRKLKKVKRVFEQADWSEEKLARLFSAMTVKGYCNWAEIKKDARLKWKISDIALGCRLCVLSLLNLLLPSDCDAEKLTSILNQYKVLRVAVAACGPVFVNPTSADYKDSDLDEDSTPPEDTLLMAHATLNKSDCTSSEALLGLALPAECGGAGLLMVGGQRMTAEGVRGMTAPLALGERDAEQRLALLEDLFHVHLACTLCPDPTTPTPTPAVLAPSVIVPLAPSEVNAGCDVGDIPVLPIETCADSSSGTPDVGILPVAAAAADPMSEDFLCGFFENAYSRGGLVAPMSWWTAALDAQLVRAVHAVGWPENKRRWLAAQAVMFPGGGDAATQQSGQVAQQATALDSKVVSRHARALVGLMRGDTVQPAKASPYAAAVLRTICRLGRPHELFASLLAQRDENTRADVDRYLLSWEALLAECGNFPSLDVPRLKALVRELVEVFDTSEDADRVIDRGLLAGISMKSVVEASSKDAVMYRIRTLLGTRTDASLARELAQRVMQTGAGVPLYARDKSMPVWWTAAHDIKLLKLNAVHGLHQWKKILQADCQAISISLAAAAGEIRDDLSIVEAPADFSMPLRENGNEWLLVLTAKTAEKRLAHILKAVDVFAPVQQLPQSPPRTSRLAPPAAKLAASKTSSVSKTGPKPSTAFNWGALSKPADSKPPASSSVKSEVQSNVSSIVAPLREVSVPISVMSSSLADAPSSSPDASAVCPEVTLVAAEVTLVLPVDVTPVQVMYESTASSAMPESTPPEVDPTPVVSTLEDKLCLTETHADVPPPTQHVVPMASAGSATQSAATDEVELVAVVTPKPVLAIDGRELKNVIVIDDTEASTEKAPVPLASAKTPSVGATRKPVVTEPKRKSKPAEAKATAKKPVPASNSILSFFAKKPTLVATEDAVAPACDAVPADGADNKTSILDPASSST